MNVVKSYTKLKKIDKQEDCFMNASPKERISFMWELTAELWSLKYKQYHVEQRLQRNITNLIKQQG